MKIPFPSGRYAGKLENAGLDDAAVQKMIRKKNICLSFGNGWAVFDKGTVLAAFYEDRFETFYGSDAFAKLLQLRGRVEFYEVDRKLLDILLEMYPEIAVCRDFHEVRLDTRALDIFDTLVSSKFFGEEVRGERNAPAGEENAEAAESTEEYAGGEDAANWVVNLEDFICNLGDYTGVIEASDGSTDFTFWLRDGKVAAAVMDDGGFIVKGNAVLYFANIPAQVRKKEWTDPPQDALCTEDEAGLRVLFDSIDRERGV